VIVPWIASSGKTWDAGGGAPIRVISAGAAPDFAEAVEDEDDAEGEQPDHQDADADGSPRFTERTPSGDRGWLGLGGIPKVESRIVEMTCL
jgi:hypothetical protein